jgi:hypothetical protein
MRYNKLSLNIDKTKYVIFKTQNKQCNITNDITVNNQVIDRVESIKFLGINFWKVIYTTVLKILTLATY